MAWSPNITANLGELVYAQCTCLLSAGKMADRVYGHSREKERSISATELFQRKHHKFFDPRCPLSNNLAEGI